jgi:hypothetical protein
VLGDNSSTENPASIDRSEGDGRILEMFLRSSSIDIPEQAEPLTYQRAEELIRQQEKVTEFVLPPRQIFEFMAQNYDANRSLLRDHRPGVFDGDTTIFSARPEKGTELSRPRNWQPYVADDIKVYPVDCGHDYMMAAESLAMYGEQLKFALED